MADKHKHNVAGAGLNEFVKNVHSINLPLPEDVRKRVIGENAPEENNFAVFIKRMSEKTDDAAKSSKLYIQLKRCSEKKWKKPVRHTTKKLSFKERRKLGLHSLDRKSLKYEDLLPLHYLWKDYMKNYISYETLEATAKQADPVLNTSLGYKLYKADYHGAEFCVKRSVCPSYVGISGIVVMETKFCFLLLGKDNITRRVPKKYCAFSFQLDKFTLSILGKNFANKSAERSSKKLKTVHPPCL